MPRNKTFNKVEVVKDAVGLFWEHGFHQTSVQDLVQRLSVNRASLYDTYGDKEGLFKRCLSLYRDEVIQTAQVIMTKEDSSKRGLNNLFTWFIESLINDRDKKGCLICNTYAELMPSIETNEINDLLNDTKDSWINILIDLLKKGSKNNEISSNIDIENSAYGIYSSMIGATILSKTNTNKNQLKSILNIHLVIFK